MSRAPRFCLITVLALVVMPLATFSHPDRVIAFHESTLLDAFPAFSYEAMPLHTDGGAVVWLAPTTATPDIHGWVPAQLKAARLPDLEPFVIADIPIYEGGIGLVRLDVDGDLVVWTEPSDPSVVHGMHLSSGTRWTMTGLTITAEDEQLGNLTFSGEWLAWSSADASTMWIKARNIAQMTDVITLATYDDLPDPLNAAFNSGPLLDEEWIVWAEGDGVKTQHLGMDDAPVHLDAPLGVLADGRYAFQRETSWATDDTAVATVAVIDLATRTERTVTTSFTDPAEGPYPVGSGIAFDGRYLYQSYQLTLSTGTVTAMQQLIAYDLESDSIFPVVRDAYVTLEAGDGLIAWQTSGDWSRSEEGATIEVARLADRLPTAPVPQGPPTLPDTIYVPETQHTLGGIFKNYWEANGGLSVFGYPLTEEFTEHNRDTDVFATTQYVERQRFEWHPENQGTPYEVLLGRLGAELLGQQGRDWHDFPRGNPTAPHYIAETGHAIDDHFFGYWTSHGLEFGDPGVSYRESLALFGYPLSEAMTETNADGDTVLTQYFERAVFEWHPEHAGTPSEVLLRRVGAETLAARGW